MYIQSVSPSLHNVHIPLHGGSPKPGTDSNEIHTKQVFKYSKFVGGTP